MTLVDAHAHVSDVWYEPAEALLAQMDRHGVGAAVLIQLLGQFHNEYQQGCLRRFPGRFASVVAVDPAAEGALAALDALARDGATGLRLRPISRSPGADPLAIWRRAEALGLAISCVGNSAQFAAPEFEAVVAAVPRLPIVLEHLAGQSRPDADDAEADARRRAFGLARHPNVLLKLPGLGELVARRPSLPATGSALADGAQVLVRAALDAFGPERLLWSSDFPVVSSREGYGAALSGVRDLLASLPPADRAAVLGGNARRVFFRGE